jgi:hypothetical protein
MIISTRRPAALSVILSPILFSVSLAVSSGGASSSGRLLLPENQVASIAAEISGLRAKDTIVELGRRHRVQASSGYDKAAEYIAEKARQYGLEQVQIERLPADGKKTYYTLKSSVGWEAQAGQLWEISPQHSKLADYDEMPVALADYSQTADVTADLIDVGLGASADDYKGVDPAGKIVLAGGPVAAVHKLACDERGAAGVLSYQPNQVTGWSGDYPDNVRWGHLSPYNPNNKVAFMISLRRARGLRDRLARGEQIKLHALVKAEMRPSEYQVVTATIPGSDLAADEIVFSCHLCHQKPGANDNASGAAAILEIARTLRQLIASGEISRPRRTIKFIWPPEITGTLAYFAQHPDEVKHMIAAVHLDMVGGDYRITKSVLHITHTPASLPSCVNAVADIFADYAISGSLRAAMDGDFRAALISPEGSKDSLVADMTPYEMGSDHDVYQEGSFRIPTIYLRDWPDVFIHTNNDTPANIDPTKLKRSAFIAASCGYFLATAGGRDAVRLADEVSARAIARIPEQYRRASAIETSGPAGEEQARNIIAQSLEVDQAAISSVKMLAPDDNALQSKIDSLIDQISGAWLVLTGQLAQEQKGKKIYFVLKQPPQAQPDRQKPRSRSKPETGTKTRPLEISSLVPYRRVAGPMNVYYYDYIADRAEPADLGIVKKISSMPHGDVLLYEILNLVDGKRTIEDIKDYLVAAYSDVPIDYVTDYMKLLNKVGVVDFREK